MSADLQPWPWKKIETQNPFVISNLPLIAKIHKIGFHKFRKRWTKRLFKRPARQLFDFCYSVLNLSGTGILEFHTNSGIKKLQFNARKLHFSTVYGHPREQIFEPQVLGLLELLMREKDVFIDVGANWGMEALHGAVLPNWTGEIHAFEPVADTYQDLESLVLQSELGSRITCHNIALSDGSGTIQMKLADGILSGTAMITGSTGDKGTFEVRREKLDDLDLPSPTFIKLDVEGHEASVFRGARDTMARCHPFVIFETWHTANDFENSEDCFQILEDFGYMFFRPVWGFPGRSGMSVWPHTQPPSNTSGRLLSLVPMDAKIRPFMGEHIDVFACHKDRLGDLRERFERNL